MQSTSNCPPIFQIMILTLIGQASGLLTPLSNPPRGDWVATTVMQTTPNCSSLSPSSSNTHIATRISECLTDIATWTAAYQPVSHCWGCHGVAFVDSKEPGRNPVPPTSLLWPDPADLPSTTSAGSSLSSQKMQCNSCMPRLQSTQIFPCDPPPLRPPLDSCSDTQPIQDDGAGL